MSSPRTTRRERPDRCPGVLRPWPADDGALVRLRLIGGRVGTSSMEQLLGVAEEFGDGRVHLTHRANLQVRGLPAIDGALPDDVVAAIAATGLLPSASHERVRNVMVSPLTSWGGGRMDLSVVGERLDTLICADPVLAGLPGRFLFVLDDGTGDLIDRACDLGLVALDGELVQLRLGEAYGDVLPAGDSPHALVGLARRFLDLRGTGEQAPWHVRELVEPLAVPERADPRLPARAAPLPYGCVAGGWHVPVPDGLIDRGALQGLLPGAGAEHLIVTPWHGVLVPEEK